MTRCKRACSNIVSILALFPANKSVVSSSMGSESTFFQRLDDHITQPVLFIPEAHLSSLQRMVGLHITILYYRFLLFCRSLSLVLSSVEVIIFPGPPAPRSPHNRCRPQDRHERVRGKNCGKVCSGLWEKKGGRGGGGGDGVSESEVKHRLDIR